MSDTDMTRGDMHGAMLSAGYTLLYIPVSKARELVTGDRDWVSPGDTYGEWSGGAKQNRATAMYYANEPLVTAYDIGDVASNCEYANATTYDASNLRSLIRDYPNRVFTVSYTHGSNGAVLLACLDDDLTETLIGLKEQYPIYDEDDHSQYESDLADAAWSQYVWSDLYRELSKRFDDMPYPHFDLDALLTEAQARDWFYRNGYADDLHDGITYESESGCPDSVIFPEFDAVAARIGDMIEARWISELLAPYTCDGQTAMEVSE